MKTRYLGDTTVATTYTVKSGDSLSDIAGQFYGDQTLYSFLQEVNNISDPNLIYPGQVLQIPPDPYLDANDDSSDDALNQEAKTTAANPGTPTTTSVPATSSTTSGSSAVKTALTTGKVTVSNNTNTTLVYVGGSLLLGVLAWFGYKEFAKKKKAKA